MMDYQAVMLCKISNHRKEEILFCMVSRFQTEFQLIAVVVLLTNRLSLFAEHCKEIFLYIIYIGLFHDQK